MKEIEDRSDNDLSEEERIQKSLPPEESTETKSSHEEDNLKEPNDISEIKKANIISKEKILRNINSYIQR
jgi:hypothetical protein